MSHNPTVQHIPPGTSHIPMGSGQALSGTVDYLPGHYSLPLPEGGASGGGEIRTIDPITGGEKGMKLARFSLIPPDFLLALAEHYGKGARKYTKYEECSCALIVKDLTAYIQDNAVDLVTRNGLGPITQNLQEGNENTAGNGAKSTQRRSSEGRDFTTVDLRQNDAVLPQNISFHLRNTISLYPNLAASVEQPRFLDMLTTIMIRVRSGDLSVTDAISELALLKSVGPNGQEKHWRGCRCFNVSRQGDRNWERGYKWSLSVDALERHLNQFKRGEMHDLETGSHHLVCVAWHAIALFVFWLRGLGTNDVYEEQLPVSHIPAPTTLGQVPVPSTTGFITPAVTYTQGMLPLTPAPQLQLVDPARAAQSPFRDTSPPWYKYLGVYAGPVTNQPLSLL